MSLAAWAARTPGFSGADLSNLLNEAAILTARRHETSIDDLALNDALERITMGLTVAPLQDSAKKRLIAYHEVGHALITTLLPKADALDKVTLLPRSGGVGGFARTTPDEDILDSGLISRAYLRDRLVVVMGGRAAELVVFGPSEITQGLPAISRWPPGSAGRWSPAMASPALGQWPWRAMPPRCSSAAT